MLIQPNRYLGAVLDERSFVEAYVKDMVEKWTHKIDILSNFALTPWTLVFMKNIPMVLLVNGHTL